MPSSPFADARPGAPRGSVGELGEHALIAAIREAVERIEQARRAGDVVDPIASIGTATASLAARVAIGDDCAVLAPPAPGEELLLEVDEAVEGIHFRLDGMSHADVGHRLATQGLSDIAAMGGAARAALLSLGLPPFAPAASVVELAEAVVEQLARHGAALVGGNITATSGPLHASITLLGTAPAGRAVLRAGAHPGDGLYITGAIGLARAGWTLLARGLAAHDDAQAALARYRRPEPQLAAARWLLEHAPPHAMIDLSDGLSGDLAALAAASGVGAVLEEARLPVDSALERAAALCGEAPTALALAGGDDFELLLAGDPALLDAAAPRLLAALGVRLTRVGTALADPGLWWLPRGAPPDGRVPLAVRSYEHFR